MIKGTIWSKHLSRSSLLPLLAHVQSQQTHCLSRHLHAIFEVQSWQLESFSLGNISPNSNP